MDQKAAEKLDTGMMVRNAYSPLQAYVSWSSAGHASILSVLKDEIPKRIPSHLEREIYIKTSWDFHVMQDHLGASSL